MLGDGHTKINVSHCTAELKVILVNYKLGIQRIPALTTFSPCT